MNKLLKRQIRRNIGDKPISLELENIFQAISNSYDHYERDRKLIERAMELSSEELRTNYLKLQKQQELKRSNKSLEQFVSVVSHDLKAPLRSIGSFSRLLHKKLIDSKDLDIMEYLNFIMSGVKTMDLLVDDLVKYAKLGNVKADRKIVNLESTIETVLKNLHLDIQSSNAKIILPNNLPRAKGNPSQLLQLFQNIIGNAIKFHGTQSPIIELMIDDAGEMHCFSIKDNGIGMHKESIDNIFNAFVRLNGMEKFEGTGLGLSICKKIVENEGGKIWAESELGKGTTFHFTLPKLVESKIEDIQVQHSKRTA